MKSSLFLTLLSICLSFSTFQSLATPSSDEITNFDTLKEAIKIYNEKAPEHELITSKQTYYEFYTKIHGAPGNPHLNIENFLDKGGFKALLPTPYRITDFNTLKVAIDAYNQKAHEHKLITSAQTYKQFYKEIHGAPYNPYQSIPNFKNDGGFNALLSKYRITDFNTLKVAIDAYNQKAHEHKLITSQKTYYQFYKEIPGAPSDPYQSIPNFTNDGGFKALLSKETPYRITDFNTLRVAIDAYNQKTPEHKLITSWQAYYQFYKEIRGIPSDLYPIIHNFTNDGGFNALLPKETPYRITDFNTLKVAIDAYNQKAHEHKLITSQQTYYQFYKEIHGAPSNPYLSIPNFTNDGGFKALLDTCSPNLFSKKL